MMATIFTRRLRAIGSQFISKHVYFLKVQMSGSCHREKEKKKEQLIFKCPHMYLRPETKKDLQIVMLNIVMPTSFMDRTENTELRT